MKYKEIIEIAIGKKILKKAVLSRPRDKSEGLIKGTVTPFEKSGERLYQLECFYKDGKARHTNMSESEAADYLMGVTERFSQINIITTGGSAEVLVSSKGSLHISGEIKSADAAEISSHDKKRNYILDPREHAAFLAPLGVCDEKGNIFDKKRSKFRQIERFLELADDLYDKFPSDGELCVCDLCCGKSYLTFAFYYYLTEIKKRRVVMYGVDLKSDVIEFCSSLARKLRFDSLTFICGDVSRFDPGVRVDAVISLHACDIATDFVLAFAIRKRARLVFSTPCCHHEMLHQISSPALSFITRYSILSQKLCDAATDSLRALMLEANGYSVEAVELIDPEETPKNVMIRAYLANTPERSRERAMNEYKNACDLLGVRPFLAGLLGCNIE